MAVASSGVVLEELECVRKTLKNGETLTVESCQKELVQLKIRFSVTFPPFQCKITSFPP